MSFGKWLLEDRVAAGVLEGLEAHGFSSSSGRRRSESESENKAGE
jgi:hypothetical protein